MAESPALAGSKLVAFLPTTDPARSRAFFEGVLGLRLVAEEPPFALVFDANGTMLRATTVQEHRPASHTVLGWQVAAIEPAVQRLAAAGVQFLRYPGLNDTGPLPIWTAPGGARIAWFHDPDKNVLSLTQF